MKEETMGTRSSSKSNGQWAAKNLAVGESGMQTQVVEKVTDVYNSVVKSAQGLVTNSNKKSANFVRQYPLLITSGALAIGFLVGAVVRRQKKN